VSVHLRPKNATSRASAVVFAAAVLLRVVAALCDADHDRHFAAVDDRLLRRFLTTMIVIFLNGSRQL